MDCRKCKNLINDGKTCRCRFFDNVIVYGMVGNEPIVENCGHWEDIEKKDPFADLCVWRPKKRVKTPDGLRYIIHTTCGRVIEYTHRGNIEAEILGERCTKCGRFIDMKWVRGMDE